MQSKGRLVLLLLVGVIVAFTAIIIRHRMTPPPVPVTETGVVLSKVLVAKRELSAGTFVQAPQDMEWQMLPADYPNRDTYLQEGSVLIEDFNGAVVRRPLRAGEPVSQSAVMRAGEGGFMSAVLEPGMRAISVGVTATSGNAGFISPGDRVDVIVTHRIRTGSSGQESAQQESVVSETFVRDVRILAVDQMLDNPDNKAILAKTVTMEVSPRQAEQVAVASEMGKISLVLRSLASAPAVPVKAEEKSETAAVADALGTVPAKPTLADVYSTRDSDVSSYLDRTAGAHVRVIRGEETENIEFY